MANIIDKKITRGESWNNYKGSRIQEFIEGEISGKIGAIYKEPGGTQVYCFANDDEMNLYLSTSGASGNVLSQFETISKYSVKINSTDLKRSYSVIEGTTGNTVDFEFKITDDNDMVPDSKASIQYSILANGTTTGYTFETQVNSNGWTYVESDLLDSYLKNGENTITITVTGLSSKASTSFIITYNLFDLSFIPSFKYTELQDNLTIEIPYTITCSETKYLDFYIDGVSATSKESMCIQDVRKDSTATIDVTNLSAGTHSLQARAYVKANDGTIFYTPSYYYTFAIEGSESPSFLMSVILDNTQKIALEGETLTINLEQFDKLTFDWSMYDYLERKLDIIFAYNGVVKSSIESTKNGEEHTFTYRLMDSGSSDTLSIYALDENDEKLFEQNIILNVSPSSNGIQETTDKLLLKLQSSGRRNEDSDKDVWECVGSNGQTYSATFSGFTWNAQQGWNEETESLVISDGASVSFNIQPMVNDWAENGGTFEIDLETFDIDNEDAVICECKNNIEGKSSAYFKVTATKAEFSTADGKAISTRYKDNERLKIAFIGNKKGSLEDDNLIYIVINGVLERAILFDNEDKIQSDAYLTIGDPNGECKVRLRSIRVYKKAITVDEAFNNYVVDSDDVQNLYEKNNVLKEGTTEIGFDEVANKLPVMIFTGDMNKLCTEGQANKNWYYFDVEYINRAHPEFNFVSFNCQMKLQGTSSLGYPRKNFKLKTKDKTFTKESYAASRYVLDENSVVGNRMLKNKTTGADIDFGTLTSMCITLDYEGNPLKKGKYRFKDGAHKADRWTLKADFMESSCSHNVGAGRSWNKIFENTELSLDINAGYTNNTYQDSALVYTGQYKEYSKDGVDYKIPMNTDAYKAQKDYVCRTEAQKICIAENADDVRTAVDGFPMVCFYRTSHTANDLVFMGQYNFINDKSSYEVFGFEDIEDPNDDTVMIFDGSQTECWEGLKNANPISLFQTTENWNSTDAGWASTYESRYPDPDDISDPDKRHYDASSASPLYELCKWLVSTRHVNYEVPTGNTLDIDSSFAERINNYQYGYTDATKESYAYVSGTSLEDNAENRQKKFETEKWEHFDVWKVAGYYIYLMRYGAVDQFVKNTMLYTEGNGRYDPRTDAKYRKWFFINYDNDCLFGLRNNGELAFNWDLDRQTLDGASDIIKDDQADDEGNVNTYAMMGHESTLWNNLEADDEFMRMVRDLDSSMNNAGLNYDNMVTEFDTNQTEQWCERIYNANERYKYIQAAKGIGDMEGNAVDNLWMLQGTRRSHRHWWIANHFDLLDAKWLSGNYKNTYVEIKTDAMSGDTITAKAGADYYYAWGQQKKIYESNMERKEGETIDFTFSTNQVQGDPVYIYAINKMSEMDFSNVAYKVAAGSFEFHIGNEEVSNTLKKLVIGNPSVINRVSGITTSTWSILSNLEYLDITNYAGIKSLPLSTFTNLHTLKASGSSISSFAPAEGSKYTLVELPSTISSLNMCDIKFDTTNKEFKDVFKYTPNTNLDSLTLSNNDGIGLIYFNNLIKPWINAINASTQYAELYQASYIDVDNIDWALSLDDVRLFKKFKTYAKKGNFNLRGTIDLRSCGNLSLANIEEIKSIFGENCFNQNTASLYVITPDSIFIEGDDSMVAGQSLTFSRIIYPDEEAIADKIMQVKYYLVEETNLKPTEDENVLTDNITGKRYLPVSDPSTLRSGLTLTNKTIDGKEYGILSAEEYVLNTDTKVIVLVKMDLIDSAIDKIACLDVTIKDPTYASTIKINGQSSAYINKEYTYTLSMYTADGSTPLGTTTTTWTVSGEGMLYVSESSITEDNNVKIKMGSQPEVSSPIFITAVVDNYDGTSVRLTKKVLALNETVIMTSESNPVALAVCYNNGWAQNSDAMTKSEAEAVTDIGTAFANISDEFNFYEFSYFTGITSLSASAFAGSNITEIAIPTSVESIGEYCFADCSALTFVSINDTDNAEASYYPTLPASITEIKEGCFMNCSSLSGLVLPSLVETISNFAFGGTGIKYTLLSGETYIYKSLVLSDVLSTIEANAFETQKWSTTSTTNTLETFSIPLSLKFKSFQPLWNKYLKDIIVADGHSSYIVKDGILFSKSLEVLIRYAPQKAYKEVLKDEIEGINTISSYALFYVQNLDTFISPSSLNGAGLGIGVFDSSNIRVIDLRNSSILRTITEYTFNNCGKAEEIHLPTANLQTIESYSFNGCSSLKEITIPSTVTDFGVQSDGYSYVFVDCDKVETIEFPDSVTTIGKHIIENCDNLHSVKFPKYWEGMEDGNETIYGCSTLSSVTLSLFSYTIDAEYSVYDATNTLIGTYNTEEEANEAKPTDGSVKQTVVEQNIVVNSGMNPALCLSTSLFEYNLNDDDDEKNYTTLSGILYTSDLKRVMRVPYSLKVVELAEGTEEVYNPNVFLNCQVEDVIFPSTLISIADKSFKSIGSLKTVTFAPDSIKSIGSTAFYECNNLTTINFPDSLEEIGDGAFRACSKLSCPIVIPEKVTRIGGYTFQDCGKVSSFTFKGEIETIGKMAFYSCFNVSAFTLMAKTAPYLEVGSSKPAGDNAYDNHPFGNKQGAMSWLMGKNATSPVLYLCYGAEGYSGDTSDANIYNWTYPLLAEDEGRFTISVLPMAEKMIYLTVYSGGTLLNDSSITLYAKSDSDNFKYKNDSSTVSTTYNSEKGYMLLVNDTLSVKEPLTIYSDAECTNALGTIIPNMDDVNYTVGTPLMSASINILGEALDEEKEVEMASITKSEYDSLVSRVKQLTEIINNMI